MDFNIGRTANVAPTTIMSVGYGGRVGIGTNSPKTTLNVAANNSGQGPILTLENTDTSITTGDVIGQIDFYANDGSSNGTGAKVNIKAVAQSGAGTVTELTFGTSPSSSATAIERMRIDASGNIEIGTSNPSGNKSIIIQAGTDSSASLRLKNDAQDWDINCQTNDTFAIYNQTSSTQPFSILPNGKVGIGTATPLSVTQGLHVVHANNEGNPTYTGAEVGIFQRNFNSSQGAAISIVGGSNSESTVNFADKDDANIGQINYQHGTNSMLFRTNDTVQLSMSNTGKMIIAPAGNITKDYRTLWNTSSTGTHYIKLYDKTGTTPNKHLHFQMYSENNSEHSVEVKVMLPTYSGFLSNYGDYTAGQGPHVEILAGGLSSQANTFSEIIAVADTSSTNDYTEIWLKIDPPATNTAISIAEFPESEVITATTSDWTTTAPSNIQKRYPIVCGQHSINNVNIGQDGKLHVTKESANTEVEALRLENKDLTMSNAQYNHAVSLGFGLAAHENGVRDSRLAAKIVGRKGAGNDWYTNGASSNFQGQLDFHTRKDDVLTNRMSLNENGTLMIGTTTNPPYPHKLYASGNSITNGTAFFEDTDVSCGLANVVLKLSFSNDNDATNASFIYMTDGNGAIGAVGPSSGTSVSYSTASDERLKENIVDASSQLDTIKNIQIREFDWKSNSHHELGLIAQEINTIIPDVVREGGDNVAEHPWSVDYGKLTPYIIKAMQEQQTIIESLTARIETLEG